jgi:L-iditol 2-dehydrogenase
MLIPSATIQQGNISELSPDTSYEAAAMIEPLACVYRGLMSCRPEPGESALVIGVGPIGLMFVQLAKIAGLKVIVSSRNQERNQHALDFGADLVFNPKEVDFQEAVLSATGGKGVDIALVAAPSGEAQTAAIEVLNHHGRINFFGGLPKDQRMTPVDANLVHYKELTITGTTGSTIKQYRTVKELVESSRINVEGLITNRFPLNEVKAAFQAAKSKTGLKTMVFPNP